MSRYLGTLLADYWLLEAKILHNKENIVTMEEKIRKMIRDLRRQTEEIVPEVGRFGIVYSQFPNNDKGVIVTDWMLKVTQPPTNVDPSEKKRYLELVAYNLPSPYIAEKVLAHGEKQAILSALLDEDGLVAKIKEKMPQLARDLEDI